MAILAAAAIQTGLFLFHWRPKSFNSHAVCDFLQDLRDTIGGNHEITIVLDNCAIHRTHKTLEQARRLSLHLMFNVPYSPWFNGIEYVFAQAKRKFRKYQLQRLLGKRKCTLEEAAVQSLKTRKKTVKKCLEFGQKNLQESHTFSRAARASSAGDV